MLSKNEFYKRYYITKDMLTARLLQNKKNDKETKANLKAYRKMNELKYYYENQFISSIPVNIFARYLCGELSKEHDVILIKEASYDGIKYIVNVSDMKEKIEIGKMLGDGYLYFASVTNVKMLATKISVFNRGLADKIENDLFRRAYRSFINYNKEFNQSGKWFLL